jgi:adenylyltransferase/sulfurtransferase
MNQITATELKSRMDAGEDVQLIDVRQPHEYDVAKIPGAKLIPMTELMSRLDELDRSREAVIHCHMGGRSARVIDALERSGYEGKLTNLSGGITAWSHEVDPSVPTY